MSDSAIVCGSYCDAGRRPNNDDSVFMAPEQGVFVVCDGAGGKMGGRRAAELICQTVGEMIGQITSQVSGGLAATNEAISSVLMQAHQRIIDDQSVNPAFSGMTSTVAMVVSIGPKVLVTHVGDSRVYLYRTPDLWQMTRDHNLENYLEDNPQYRPKVKRPGKTLLQALGLKTSRLNIEQSHFDLQAGDLVMLCSDGLTDAVPAWALREILEGARESSVDSVVQSLGRAALRHGSMDNISALVLYVNPRPHDSDEPKTAIFDIEQIAQAAGPKMAFGWLAFVDGGRRGDVVTLEAMTVVGADQRCAIHLDDGYVSARHAEVFRIEQGYVLRDLRSTNGTHINNTKVTSGAEVRLVDGDIVKIGTTEMIFKTHLLDAAGR